MDIILIKDVEKLGKAGQVVKAKDGFARNFLIPKGLAVQSNAANLKKLEEEKQKKLQLTEKVKKEFEQVKQKLDATSLTIPVLTQEEDRLYGSITSNDIASALKEEGIEIDKNSIVLEEPIKALGIYEVPVRLHPEVSAKLKIWIVKK